MAEAQYDPRYLRGIEQFNERNFFESHEILGIALAGRTGAFAAVLQGADPRGRGPAPSGTRKRPRRTRKLWASSRRYLEPYRSRHLGLDVDAFLAALSGCLAEALERPEQTAPSGPPPVWCPRSRSPPHPLLRARDKLCFPSWGSASGGKLDGRRGIGKRLVSRDDAAIGDVESRTFSKRGSTAAIAGPTGCALVDDALASDRSVAMGVLTPDWERLGELRRGPPHCLPGTHYRPLEPGRRVAQRAHFGPCARADRARVGGGEGISRGPDRAHRGATAGRRSSR